jgi:hypothetical protein
VVLPKNIQSIATVEEGPCIVWIYLNRTVEQTKRFGIMSRLKRNAPQKMKRAGMEGRAFENLPAEGFRLGQLPGLVVGRSFLEQKVHRGRTGSCRLPGE